MTEEIAPPAPPTIMDNIHDMARLAMTVKKQYHLTENTVMRIIDMNFALADRNRSQQMPDLPDYITADETDDEPVLAAIEE